jgi:hypothetical protein
MKKTAILLAIFSASIFLANCGSNPKKEDEMISPAPTVQASVQDVPAPFLDHRSTVPPENVYKGPLFALNHDYPESPLPPMAEAPWQKALKGKPISKFNAIAYVDSLKAYVAPMIRKFLYDRQNWSNAKEGWYQEPWTGIIRESIMGAYIGSGFGPGTFTSLPDSAMTTYVLTFYDKRAAYTLGKLWGKTGKTVNLKNNAAQFDEGSIIVKFAFSTVNAPVWPVMQGALQFPIYDTSTSYHSNYMLEQVSFFQFDIIVKDTVTAPGKTAWDKMIPLGAQWGNDPQANSTKDPKAPLKQNVINPAAPTYSIQTLGWGGRMSGPNDGAVIPQAVDVTTHQTYKNLAASSCMSCHSVAQDELLTFLLPGPFPSDTATFLPVYSPGGAQWLQFFQNRHGGVPFNTGQVALDFDMVTAFKSIPIYLNAGTSQEAIRAMHKVSRNFLLYNRKYNGR